MKRALFIVCFLLFCAYNVFGQIDPDIIWQKSLGGVFDEYGYGLCKTYDNGYVTCGFASSSNGDITNYKGGGDAWVVKVSSTGSMLWEKTLGGSDYEMANSVIDTWDSSYVVTGYTYSTDGDVTVNKGNSDFWVVKLDKFGNKVWQKSYGGTGYDVATSVSQAYDSGYVVCGYTTSSDGDLTSNHGNYDYWVIKIDKAGALIWQKTFGGSADDKAVTIKQTVDSGSIIAGYTESANGDITSNHGSVDYWLMKIDKNGAMVWQKTYGGSDDDVSISMDVAPDGSGVICGFTSSNDGDVTGLKGLEDMWVVKFSNNGALAWQKTLGGSAYEEANFISRTSDNNYFLGGYTTSHDGDVTVSNNYTGDYWLIKLSSTSNILWQKTIGGDSTDIAFGGLQANDGGYVVTGHTQSNNKDVATNHGLTTGTADIWILKLSPNTSVKNTAIQTNKVKTFPNPVQTKLMLENISEFDHVSIYDMTGKIVHEEKVISNVQSINLAKLVPGIYNLTLTDKSGSQIQKRIVKN